MSTGHDLLVFGGAARTGLALVAHARRRGLRVAAFVRPGRDTAGLAALGVTLVRGDAFSPEDCRRAFSETMPQAALSVLGGKDASGRRVDAEGNLNVIDAAEAWLPGLRFLLLTSVGCGEQYAALPPPIRQALGEALEAKTRAEEHLRASSLAWTIVRPTGLADATPQGRYRLCETPEMAFTAYLARDDAALAALEVLLANDTRKRALSILPESAGV